MLKNRPQSFKVSFDQDCLQCKITFLKLLNYYFNIEYFLIDGIVFFLSCVLLHSPGLPQRLVSSYFTISTVRIIDAQYQTLLKQNYIINIKNDIYNFYNHLMFHVFWKIHLYNHCMCPFELKHYYFLEISWSIHQRPRTQNVTQFSCIRIFLLSDIKYHAFLYTSAI